MSSTVRSLDARQPSVVRKPVARKALPCVSSQNVHENAIEPPKSSMAHVVSHTQQFRCELQGSPVPSQSQPNQAASLNPTAPGAVVPPYLPSTVVASSPSSHASMVKGTVGNGAGTKNEAVVQCPVSEMSAGSNGHPDAPCENEPSSTTTQLKTNQARRMQRRTMMMSVTANVGSTSTQSVPSQFTSPFPPPDGLSPAGPLSSAPSPKAETPPQAAHPAHPAHPQSPALGGISMAIQPSSSIGFPVPSGLSTRKPIPPMSYPSLSSQIQSSAMPHTPTPQTMLPAVLIEKTSPGQQNFAGQQHHKSPVHRAAVMSATSNRPQTQNLPSPPLTFSSAQNRPPNQRSLSIQSAQTVSSLTSVRSSPNSASSVASPVTSVATPSTVYSPLSLASETMRKRSIIGPDTSDSYFSICSSCKIGLTPGVSFFECLVCASGNTKVYFCIYCYTTGAAAGRHLHEPSYYICATDPLAPDASLSARIWTIRKNAMNRVWYQHNFSQYKTYIRPMTAGLNGLPPGWQERQNPEGRTYYFHASSGKSTWTKPGRKLPPGWKEVKTPDGKPFYVHEEYQLSTWHWPGQQPGQNDNPQPSQKPSQKKAVAPAGSKAERSVTNRRASAVVSGVTTAATLSTSALDIASDPIMGTTKAIAMGARWAARGFKGKKAKKMLNQVGMKNMKKIAGAAINIAADGDDFDLGDEDGDEDDVGDGDDGNDGGEGDDEDVCGTGLTDSTNDCNSNGFDQSGYGDPQQNVSSDPGFVEPQSQTMDNQAFMQQGCGVDSYGQVSNIPDCYQEAPPPMINNVNVIENSETGNVFVDQSVDIQTIDQNNQIYADQSVSYQSIDQSGQNYVDQNVNYQYIDQSNNQAYVDQSINNQFVDQSTQNYVDQSIVDQSVGQSIQQQWVDNSQDTLNIDAQQNQFVNADVTNNGNEMWNNSTTQDLGVAVPPQAPGLNAPDAQYTPLQPAAGPCTSECLPPAVGQPPVVEQQQQPPPPAPFVFEPMLAAPMMVEPPASSNGVVFAPQYPSTNDSSAALALI